MPYVASSRDYSKQRYVTTAHQLLSIQNFMRSWQFPSQSKNPVTFVTPTIHYSPPLVPTPSHINSGHRFISTVPSQQTPALQANFVLEIFPPNACNYFSYVPVLWVLGSVTRSVITGRRQAGYWQWICEDKYFVQTGVRYWRSAAQLPQLPGSPSMKLTLWRLTTPVGVVPHR